MDWEEYTDRVNDHFGGWMKRKVTKDTGGEKWQVRRETEGEEKKGKEGKNED